jgi:proline iminopeptidase
MTGAGWLPVSGGHEIYWHEYGDPDAPPVMFLHGGPGGRTSPKQARFFNPRRYRIILFDQRGCGESRPNASADDPQIAARALEHNTTDHLIEDIEALRQHLGISEPMLVFGGSWGSTLALAYAIKHPEQVRNLILRGIFLCRRRDLDYFYQGNASIYAQRPFDVSLPGTYMFYPDAWKTFLAEVPGPQRGDMVAAYSEIFKNASGEALERAAKAWSVWEGITSYLSPGPDLSAHEDTKFAKAFARIENHYFMNGGFLGGSGAANRDNNYLLENAKRIARHPMSVHIVQGRFDQVCPRYQADELVEALQSAERHPRFQFDWAVTTAGHSQYEPDTVKALTGIMDKLSKPVVPRPAANRARR